MLIESGKRIVGLPTYTLWRSSYAELIWETFHKGQERIEDVLHRDGNHYD